MFVKYLGIGLEAAKNIFRWFNAVYTHDDLLVLDEGLYLVGGTFSCHTLHNVAFACDRDRDGIGACLNAASLPPDSTLFKIDGGSFQEIARVTVCLEANDIVTNEACIDIISDVAGQQVPAALFRSATLDHLR